LDSFKLFSNIACPGSEGSAQNTGSIAKEDMSIAVSCAEIVKLMCVIFLVVKNTYANLGIIKLSW